MEKFHAVIEGIDIRIWDAVKALSGITGIYFYNGEVGFIGGMIGTPFKLVFKNVSHSNNEEFYNCREKLSGFSFMEITLDNFKKKFKKKFKKDLVEVSLKITKNNDDTYEFSFITPEMKNEPFNIGFGYKIDKLIKATVNKGARVKTNSLLRILNDMNEEANIVYIITGKINSMIYGGATDTWKVMKFETNLPDFIFYTNYDLDIRKMKKLLSIAEDDEIAVFWSENNINSPIKLQIPYPIDHYELIITPPGVYEKYTKDELLKLILSKTSKT